MVILFLAACSNDGRIPLQYCEDATQERSVDELDRPLTWHADVAPIVAARCQTCHSSELAPFSLDTPDAFAARAEVVELSVLAGRMPPWSADDCCGKTYRADRSLPQEELDVLVSWLRQGTPEGDPATAAPIDVPTDDLPRVDLTVGLPEPYGATPIDDSSDDLRCFLVDIPEAARGRYVTGFAVRPGNVAIVHHVGVNAVASWGQAAFERLDARDDALGWECRGGEGALGDRQLGVWVPGQDALVLPEGLGVKMPNRGKIILNMHYDLTSVGNQTALDQTQVELMLADEVEHEVEALAVMNPMWVFDEGMKVEGDFAESGYGFRWDPQPIYGIGTKWDIWGAFVHMHEQGTSSSVAILRGREEQECLLHISDWNYYWQANYWFDQPTRLDPGDRLYMECNWRNPGETMAWGDDAEMCGAVVYGSRR